MMTDPPPSRVFESVSTDYFHHAGRTYLVYADRLSGWPIVRDCAGEASSRHLISALRDTFSSTGVPSVLRSDGGPQFAAKLTRDFLARWGVTHVLSSPHYPQSNGHAEAAVKSVKRLIEKTTERGELDDDAFARGLLELRNSPRADGRSAAQVLFGHPLQSPVPAHHRAFAAEWQTAADVCDERAAALREKVRHHYDKTARPLQSIRLGATVDVQDTRTGLWDRTGSIVGVGDRRDYLVKMPNLMKMKMPNGRVYWRNRRFLRPHRFLLPSSVCGRDAAVIPPPKPLTDASKDSVRRDRHAAPVTAEPRRSGRSRKAPERLVVNPQLKSYC